jgi:hypothetical protein
MKKTILLAVILILMRVGAASAADRWRLVSIPLDMPESDEQALDNQALEGLYQGDYGQNMPHNYGGYIGPNLKSSVLQESPFYHYDTTLKDGRALNLWFSSEKNGRKVFGVLVQSTWSDKPPTKSYDLAVKELQAAYGTPDLEFSPPSLPAQHIFVFADGFAPDHSAIAAALPKAGQIADKDKEDFWHLDLRSVARILGPDFRGAVAIFTEQKGKLASQSAELLDLPRARTVFNLDDLK